MFKNNNLITNSILSTGGALSYYNAPTVADFERLIGTTSGGNTVIVNRTVSAADIGKVVAIKEARDYAAYRTAPITWNGVVTAASGSTLTLSNPLSQTLIDVVDKEVMIGTNNFDIIYTAIAYCAANDIDVLTIPHEGIAWVVPQLSFYAPTLTHSSDNFRGLEIKSNLTIQGSTMLEEPTTILKWGTEDNINLAGEYEYAGFTWGAVNAALSRLIMEAPDRQTLRSASNNAALRARFISGAHKSIYLRNVKITGHRDNGWHSGFYDSRGGDGTYQVRDLFNNVEITARCPITIFNGDGAYTDFIVRDLTLVGGGSKEYRPQISNAASITSGTTTVTIANNPEFSWYDCNSYESGQELPYILINGTFKARVTAITNSLVATIDTAAPSTFTNAPIQVFGRGRGGEGHAMYIHPNVNLDIDGLTITECIKLGLHYHSGGGVLGNVTMRSIKNMTCISVKPVGYPTTLVPGLWEWVNCAIELDNTNNASNIPYTIENSNIYLDSCFDRPFVITDSYIQGGHFGNGVITRCTGVLQARGNGSLTFNDIQGASILDQVLNPGSPRELVLNSCGTTTALSGINIISSTDITMNNVKTRDLYFYKPGVVGAITEKTNIFTNLDIRNVINFGWAFAGTAWTTPEKEDFITNSTFSGCTAGTGAAYNNIDVLIKPYFTET